MKKKKTEIEDINHTSSDKREAFRYDYKPGEGPTITFKGKQLELINISAGGIAFYNKNFEPLDFDHIKLTLDIPNYTGDPSFFAGLRILKIDSDNLCHCIFEQCPLEQHELLHKYVLEMQKNDLAH